MSENPFGEFLQVTHRQTLEFFYRGLREVVTDSLTKEDFLYPASVLAHYAKVSCASKTDFPCPMNLSFVFDNFIDPHNPEAAAIYRSPDLSEIAATQCLFLSGFFEKQMRGRHSITWYTQMGRKFFYITSELTVDREKEARMTKMCEQFEIWQDGYSKLNRHLWESRYIIRTPIME